MNIRIASGIGLLSLAALPFLAQAGSNQAQAPANQPPAAANQPKISDAQRQALLKLQTDAQGQKWDDVLKDSTDLIENFPESPYKQKVLYVALQAAGNVNSYDQLVVWGDRVIQSDPNDIFARVQLADAIADHTRENDLDKDQSLKKVDDYAHQALTLLQNTTAAPSTLPIDPAKWPEVKQDLTGRAYYALGVAAELKKNYPEAEKDFGTAVQGDATNNIFLARLLRTYMENKQYDDAIGAAQKAIDNPASTPAVKNVAQTVKTQATTAKASAK
jgi:tetratricopeptide (TPR) repeat protein